MDKLIEYYHPKMVEFVSKHGYEAFCSAVWYGAFEEVAMSYIHPADELRNLPDFDDIMMAFVHTVI